MQNNEKKYVPGWAKRDASSSSQTLVHAVPKAAPTREAYTIPHPSWTQGASAPNPGSSTAHETCTIPLDWRKRENSLCSMRVQQSIMTTPQIRDAYVVTPTLGKREVPVSGPTPQKPITTTSPQREPYSSPQQWIKHPWRTGELLSLSSPAGGFAIPSARPATPPKRRTFTLSELLGDLGKLPLELRYEIYKYVVAAEPMKSVVWEEMPLKRLKKHYKYIMSSQEVKRFRPPVPKVQSSCAALQLNSQLFLEMYPMFFRETFEFLVCLPTELKSLLERKPTLLPKCMRRKGMRNHFDTKQIRIDGTCYIWSTVDVSSLSPTRTNTPWQKIMAEEDLGRKANLVNLSFESSESDDGFPTAWITGLAIRMLGKAICGGKPGRVIRVRHQRKYEFDMWLDSEGGLVKSDICAWSLARGVSTNDCKEEFGLLTQEVPVGQC